MSGTTRFTAATKAAQLEQLAGSEVPLVLRIEVGGATRKLLPEIKLFVLFGRLFGVDAGELEPARALLRLALATDGEITASRELTPSEPLESFPLLRESLADAEAQAAELGVQVGELGGFESKPAADPARVSEAPTEAEQLLGRLADGTRGIVELIHESPYDEFTTVDLLHRLKASGLLRLAGAVDLALTGWDAPGPMERLVGGMSPPAAPPPQPKPEIHRGPKSSPPAKPLSLPVFPLDESEVTHEIIGAAIGRSRTNVYLVGIGIVLLLGGLFFFATWKGNPVSPPVPSRPDSGLVKTATVPKTDTSTQSEFSLSSPPPIAGPEADARLRQAERLINAGRLREAGSKLEELRDLLPDNVTVWVLSAHHQLEAGRDRAALDFVAEAHQIDSRHYRAWVIKGSALQFQHRIDEAIRAYRRALQIAPGHPMSPELEQVVVGLEGSKPTKP